MFFVKFFFIFSIFVFIYQKSLTNFEKSENIFLKKLNNLLEFCAVNPEKVDEGTILGILVAKGQIKFLKDEVAADFLGRKIDTVLSNFDMLSGGREIGD